MRALIKKIHLFWGFDLVTFGIFPKKYLQILNTSGKTIMSIAIHKRATPDPPMATETGRGS